MTLVGTHGPQLWKAFALPIYIARFFNIPLLEYQQSAAAFLKKELKSRLLYGIKILTVSLFN